MEKRLRVALALLVGMTITCVSELIPLTYGDHLSLWARRMFAVLTIPAGIADFFLLDPGSTYRTGVLLGAATDFVFYSVLTWILLGRPWRVLFRYRAT